MALISFLKEILEDMRRMDLEILTHWVSTRLANLQIQPTLHDQRKEAQKDDAVL